MVVAEQQGDEIGPFEWLTSSASLSPILSTLNFASTCATALHVGCGSSTLGEYLIERHEYAHVVNIDIDKETLDKMEQRWRNKKAPDDDRLEFRRVDLASDPVPFPAQFFDLVMDKSALDCTLCSDKATTGLLCETYRVLKGNGVYFVVSFHHPEFLIPLLRDIPGADWTIEHQVLRRQLDTLNRKSKECSVNDTSQLDELQPPTSRWSTGEFVPDENYNTTVTVLLCRKGENFDRDNLDPDEVHKHVYETSKIWFQSQDPMVTPSRRDELKIKFGSESKSLQRAYLAIFTDTEREHLDFDYFMEDWNAFLESRPTLETEFMTAETAVEFLEEMQ